ncbi:MAG: endolytic transglycosylase MltG [Gammaproteobacteria bacterium]|nr:endolytic transglycosylase MltG [Gammaproteobacteria bacterium]
MNNLFKGIVKNKWYLFMIIIGILIIIKGVYTYSQYKDFLQTPLIINGASIEYKIKPGVSMRKIAKDLTREGLLEHPTYLIVRARMRKLAQSIKVGEYVIRQGTFPDELLDQFVKGKVKQYALTIIEGWNFREVMKAVNKHPDLRHTLAGKTDAEIMKAIGYEGMHPEGRFYPDTYRFPAMTTDVEFLKRAYRHMEKILDQAWENKAEKLPLTTPYQALILASIIEKETGSEK